MDVSSISGMQSTMLRQDVVAHDVANVNTDGFSQRTVVQTDMNPEGTRVAAIRAEPNTTGKSNTDLAVESGEQIQNKHALSANAAALRTKDDMVGEVINLLA